MNRRELLAGVACSAIAAPALAQEPAKPAAPPPDLFADDAPFSREAVQDLARALATKGFEAPRGFLPQDFGELPQEVYRSIQMKPEKRIWDHDSLGFGLDLEPGGFIYRTPVRIALVRDGRVKMVADDPAWFDFGRAPPPPADRPFPLAGFSALAAIERPEDLRDFLTFQGATIFRAIARGQAFGTSSRGLAIDVGEPNGEEFPIFRALWIERPQGGSNTLAVHALLDSRRVSGAYRFVIRPGEITTIDVELSLFPRERLGHVGIAPMTSMYLFGSNDRAGVDDVRGEAHRSDGLQMWNGGGEWIWRPLSNPRDLQISVFGDKGPRGFGLFQRERAFRTYNDLGRRFERMPSLWVQPIGDWGEGHFQLTEIPTDTDINENIVVYWRPKQPIAPGAPFDLAYRMNWCWQPPDRAAGATVATTWSGGAGGRRRRFAVDFVGDGVADPARAPSIRPMVSASVGRIGDVSGQAHPDIKGYRVNFVLDPGDEELCELRLALETDQGRLGETWLYRWTP